MPLTTGSELAVIPTALLFSRYRTFLEPTRLALAPLTLIIGKNGGGKSVLTRLPLLIESGLASDAIAPLDLGAGGIVHAARFEDLIHQRSAQPFSLGAEISDGSRTLKFHTTLRHLVEQHTLGIEAFELSDNNGPIVRLFASNPENIGLATAEFTAKFGTDEQEQIERVTFAGLFPRRIGNRQQITSEINAARMLFEAAFKQPSYLGPYRSEKDSFPRVPRQGVRYLGPRGERALDILSDESLLSGSMLIRKVEDWFEEALAGNRLKLERVGNFLRVLVHDPIRNIDIDMAETGAGFAQVFPIVVQAFARQAKKITSPLLIVEQPELHLHPAAQGGLADLMISTVNACQAENRYICETHSEQLIMRIRRRVAEGVFSSDAVKIISVGHQSEIETDMPEPLRVIGIDEQGNTDSWPVGVFDEAFDELVHLRNAQLEANRLKDGA